MGGGVLSREMCSVAGSLRGRGDGITSHGTGAACHSTPLGHRNNGAAAGTPAAGTLEEKQDSGMSEPTRDTTTSDSHKEGTQSV